jgi:NADPH:quinone reductase-like Zn-dependent oxidoreductase
MPNTMTSLTFLRKGRLEWRDVPAPRLHGPLEALVRPIVASRCDGDCMFLFHDFSRALQLGAALHVIDPEVRELGDRPSAGPFAYGHECVAEVIDVGDAVRGVTIGQRVVVPWAISCGACGACGRGLTSHCERKASALAAYGFGGRTGGWGGMVSDLLRVPFADGMLVPVPAGVSPLTLAGASDNLPDAWRTVAPHLREQPVAPVLVVGGAARCIGLYAAGIAVALGASQVDVRWRPRSHARPRAALWACVLLFAALGAPRRLHDRRLLLSLRDAAAALAHVPEGRAAARRRLESPRRPAGRPRSDCRRPVRPHPRDGARQSLGRVPGRVLDRGPAKVVVARRPAFRGPNCSAVVVAAL